MGVVSIHRIPFGTVDYDAFGTAIKAPIPRTIARKALPQLPLDIGYRLNILLPRNESPSAWFTILQNHGESDIAENAAYSSHDLRPIRPDVWHGMALMPLEVEALTMSDENS